MLYYIYCSAGGTVVFFCSEKLYLLSERGHTNVEKPGNPEYSGNSLNSETQGSGNSVQPQGKL